VKNAVDYLRNNNFDVSTGLFFTCRDYDFIIEHDFEKIVIHEGRKGREEWLTKSDILSRIKDLYYLHKKPGDDSVNMEAVEEIFQKEGRSLSYGV
jgi:hypothetical protein